jgi:hypothetical protein
MRGGHTACIQHGHVSVTVDVTTLNYVSSLIINAIAVLLCTQTYPGKVFDTCKAYSKRPPTCTHLLFWLTSTDMYPRGKAYTRVLYIIRIPCALNALYLHIVRLVLYFADRRNMSYIILPGKGASLRW